MFCLLATVILSDLAEAGSQLTHKNASQPIIIEADDGIEWFSKEKFYLARGNASAKKGLLSVRADILKALYRDTNSKKNEIYRLEAAGKIVIQSPERTAYGDQGIYDLDRSVILVEGKNLLLKTQLDTVTASDSLEYWEKRNIAIARGNATATRGDKEIRADILNVKFKRVGSNSVQAVQMDASGGVTIRTPREVIIGNEGIYDVVQGIVTLTGDVKITRGESQLNGSIAEVNLQNGISRLISAKSLSGEKKVRGLFIPEPRQKKRE